jgi:predicted unusual protein kinase regulating ubiquinone biosynthesis (AarF/ABC1/UbiB family)
MNSVTEARMITVNLPAWRLGERSQRLMREAGALTQQTIFLPRAFGPLSGLLATEEPITQPQLAAALDDLFQALYLHPLNKHARSLTTCLRRYNLIPNEQTTEKLIRYVVDQVIARSPVPVPEAVVNEFWAFFRELFSEPELRGLSELSLDIVRLVLRTYEPQLVDVINLLKESRRINQAHLNDLLSRVQTVRGDLTIIRRQIRAIRYVKPFFQTDPRDFRTQAQIVAQMVREFGPFFIKMAQVAAANTDFLPDEIAKELAVFQEDVPPMSPVEVLKAFDECYGQDPGQYYVDFDVCHPLKSGSIGCVYLAKKRTVEQGREILVPVIIKVGRHNLDREFKMGITTLGLTLLSSQFWAPHSKLTPFLEAMLEQATEFSRGFERELDFEAEARTQNKFARRSQRSQIWNVPRVYAANRRILEMEYLEGAVGINRAAEQFAPRHPERFRRQIGERFLYTVLMHILVYKEIHGDLHPGNVMVNRNGDLFFIDWGNSVRLRGKWQLLWCYLTGILSANIDLLTDTLIKVSTKPAENALRRDEIREELGATLRKKNIKPLGRNFLMILHGEGIEGIHRRFQAALQLMSNTQSLGLVIEGEYLHLSRSVVALSGSYASLYEGLPRLAIVIDVTTTLSKFPMSLVQDRFQSKRKTIVRRVCKSLLRGDFLKGDLAGAAY